MKRTTKYKPEAQVINNIVDKAWKILKGFKESEFDTNLYVIGEAPNRVYTWVKDEHRAIPITLEVFKSYLKDDIQLQIRKDKTCFIYADPCDAMINIEDDRPGENGTPIDFGDYKPLTLVQTDIKLYITKDHDSNNRIYAKPSM